MHQLMHGHINKFFMRGVFMSTVISDKNTHKPTLEELVESVLYTREMIDKRIKDIAKDLVHYYLIESNGKDLDLIVITMRKGGQYIASDLIKEMTNYLRELDDSHKKTNFIEIIPVDARITSTKGTEISNFPTILEDINRCTLDEYVLIVEDVVEGGVTLDLVVHLLNHWSRKPKDLKIFCLVDKRNNRNKKCRIKLDVFGFVYEGTRWLVGKGLDYLGRFRNLTFIGTIRSEYEIH